MDSIVKNIAKGDLSKAKSLVKEQLKKKLAVTLDEKRKEVYKSVFRKR